MTPSIPPAAAVALIECAAKVLCLDPADVETVDFSVSHDVIEAPNETGSIHRELGSQHVNIMINMKPGARALWIDKE